MNTAPLAQLANFELTRLSLVPGKLLSLQLEGIAWQVPGPAAVEEYQAQFYRPSSVRIRLKYAPTARLQEFASIDLSAGRVVTEAGQTVRIAFDAGTIEVRAQDFGCFQLRRAQFTRNNEPPRG